MIVEITTTIVIITSKIINVIQATIGILLGGLAGYYGGWVDLALSRLFELMLGIPTFFLILTVAAILPHSTAAQLSLRQAPAAATPLRQTSHRST